jgi:hypothetical protein
MKPKIRIIKRGDQKPKEPELERHEKPSRQSTLEITSTIKLWISEFKERRRTDEHRARGVYKQILERWAN